MVPRSGGNQGDDGGGDKGHSEATIGWMKKGNQDDGGGNGCTELIFAKRSNVHLFHDGDMM